MDRSTTRRPSDDDSFDQVIVLHNVSWRQYEQLMRGRDGTSPRMAYLDGDLELVTTGARHGWINVLLARLLEIYAVEMDIELNGYATMTHKAKRKRAGAEADDCYWIGRATTAPDLAIEVVITSGIDKVEVWRRLGVRELWMWIDGAIHVHVLVEGNYEKRRRSELFPDLDLKAIEKLVATTDESKQTQAVRAFQRSLRTRR